MMKETLLLLLLMEEVELKLVLGEEGLHVGLHLHLHELPVDVGPRRLLHGLCSLHRGAAAAAARRVQGEGLC